MGLPPGPSGADGPHAFVDDLEAPVLTADDDHHLRRVQRLRPGRSLTISDGAGRWRLAHLGAEVGEVDPVGSVEVVPRPTPPIAVAFALLKGDRNEWVVQKLTELGVDRIVPLAAERCVVRWDPAKAARNVTRLRTVAREASMQSRRCWLPTVDEVTPFAAIAAESGAVRADRGGSALDPDALPSVVLVGPEGGWSESEVAQVPIGVRVAAQVLRADTAAVAVAAVLGHESRIRDRQGY